VNISFLAEKLPYSQIGGIKVGPPYKKRRHRFFKSAIDQCHSGIIRKRGGFELTSWPSRIRGWFERLERGRPRRVQSEF